MASDYPVVFDVQHPQKFERAQVALRLGVRDPRPGGDAVLLEVLPRVLGGLGLEEPVTHARGG